MEVMNRASIILLLSCGAVVVSAGPLSRPSSGTYSGVVGRRSSQNYNSNVNTNIVSVGTPRPTVQDPNPTLEEADPKTASLATSAAEAAMSIVKSLTTELSENAAAAIAEAISRILTGRSEPAYSRRNYNVNTNTNTNMNTNIIGHGRESNVENSGSPSSGTSAGLFDLGNNLGTESSDLRFGSSTVLPYGTMNFDVPHVYRDEFKGQRIPRVTLEPDVDEDEEDNVTPVERIVDPDGFENESKASASKTPSRHLWSHVNRRTMNHNTEENDETDPRSSTYHRRLNPTANSSATNFRHDINSNDAHSELNNFKHNVNNKMSQRSRTRRD